MAKILLIEAAKRLLKKQFIDKQFSMSDSMRNRKYSCLRIFLCSDICIYEKKLSLLHLRDRE